MEIEFNQIYDSRQYPGNFITEKWNRPKFLNVGKIKIVLNLY